MEFIFELFAEMLGVEESRRPELTEAQAPKAEAAMNGQEEPDTQAVNIFNVVNFH